jgi:hypothetical protein
VKNVIFYASLVKMSIPDSVQELHLREYQVQSRQMTAANLNLSFSVPASTVALHLFLQEGTAGSSAAAPPSNFRCNDGSDLNLQVLQVTFDNLTLPQTRWKTAFTLGEAGSAGRNQSLLQQMYWQGLVARQSESNPGGSETYNQWLDRGPLYSFYFSRDAASRSTDVQVQIAYNPAPGGVAFATTSRLFLIAEHTRTCEITTSQGLVTAVRALNV